MQLHASDYIAKRTGTVASYMMPPNANTHFLSDHVQMFHVPFMKQAESEAEGELGDF